jgi:hypothetical protein
MGAISFCGGPKASGATKDIANSETRGSFENECFAPEIPKKSKILN